MTSPDSSINPTRFALKVQLKQRLLDPSAENMGGSLTPRCVIIHSTGVPYQKAETVADYFQQAETSAHFVVGDKEIIQVVPLNRIAYHAGKGYPDFSAKWKAMFGCNPNKVSIGIEMVEGPDHHVSTATLINTFDLIKQLNLPWFTHGEVTGKNCPLESNKHAFWESRFSELV